MSTNNKDMEERLLKQKFEISTWMRNHGVDDGDDIPAEEVQSLLEDYFIDLESFIQAERKLAQEEERERILKEVLNILDGMGMDPKYALEALGFNTAVDTMRQLVQDLTTNEVEK